MRVIKIGDKEYRIHYGQNAICALEDELDESISGIYDRLQKENVRLSDFRAILWAGLLKEHRGLSTDDVGNMCDEAGINISALIPDCIDELNKSFQRFIPKEDSEAKEKNE